MAETTWASAIVLAVLAGWIDWRSRRLPNWLTVSGFAAGIIANTAFSGWGGAKAALIGAGIPLALLLPVVMLRGLGAGDWKLMGALGAIVGKSEILHVLLVTIIFAGVIAGGQMIAQKRVWITLKNLWELVRGFFIFGLKPHPEMNINNSGASTLPFGVAAAAATLLCWGAILTGILNVS
jgi:prepilin peptidase CpaA